MSVACRVFDNGLRAIPSSRVTEIMLDLLSLKPTDKLMEIGTGSGTQTEVWQNHCAEVHSIEMKQCQVADYLGQHVYLHAGDGLKGLPSDAPFDAIVVTCGIEEIPEAWKQQLTPTGRIVVPIGRRDMQRVTLFQMQRGHLLPVRVGCYARFQMIENA